MAYSRTGESWVLIWQPVWSELPESRCAAFEGCLQARALVGLDPEVLAGWGE